MTKWCVSQSCPLTTRILCGASYKDHRGSPFWAVPPQLHWKASEMQAVVRVAKPQPRDSESGTRAGKSASLGLFVGLKQLSCGSLLTRPATCRRKFVLDRPCTAYLYFGEYTYPPTPRASARTNTRPTPCIRFLRRQPPPSSPRGCSSRKAKGAVISPGAESQATRSNNILLANDTTLFYFFTLYRCFLPTFCQATELSLLCSNSSAPQSYIRGILTMSGLSIVQLSASSSKLRLQLISLHIQHRPQMLIPQRHPLMLTQ